MADGKSWLVFRPRRSARRTLSSIGLSSIRSSAGETYADPDRFSYDEQGKDQGHQPTGTVGRKIKHCPTLHAVSLKYRLYRGSAGDHSGRPTVGNHALRPGSVSSHTPMRSGSKPARPIVESRLSSVRKRPGGRQRSATRQPSRLGAEPTPTKP